MSKTPFRQQFAAAVRQEPVDLFAATLLIAAAARPTTADSDTANARDAIESLVNQVPTAGEAANRMRSALARFQGSEADYGTLEASLLPNVLTNGHGLPISLSVIWLEVARRCDIPAFGVGLPGHFVVAVGAVDGYHELVDPFSGGRRLKQHEIHRIVGRQVSPADLRPWESVEILQRILSNIRNWARRPDRLGTRKWALQYALALPRHAIDLERQLGETLAQLGGFREASEAFERYADVIESVDVEAAEVARRKSRQFRAQLN